MNKIVKMFLIAFFLLVLMWLSLGPKHFCFPGVVDNGPGTIGCFYSE